MGSARSPAERRAQQDRWQAAFWVALLTFMVSLLAATLIVLHAGGTSASTPPAAATEAAATAPSATETTGAAATAAPNTASPAPSPRAAQGPIQGDVPSAPLRQDDSIAAAVRDVIGADTSGFGVVVKRLSDGRGMALNDDQVFYAASTFKLAILYEAERRISEGTLSLDDTLTLTDDDLKEDLGTIKDVELGPDNTISIGDALRVMVTMSDNSTAVALLHLLGGAQIDATMADLGMLHTDLNTEELPTTAGDMALLMEAVYNGWGLSPEAQQHARSLLLQQDIRDGIPQGIPNGVPVGNKTGTWDGATHDVAFVEAPSGVYVIAVLSSGSWAWTPLQDISAAVYAVMASP